MAGPARGAVSAHGQLNAVSPTFVPVGPNAPDGRFNAVARSASQELDMHVEWPSRSPAGGIATCYCLLSGRRASTL